MSESPIPHAPGQTQPFREGIFLFRQATAEAVAGTIQALGAQPRPYAVAADYPFWVYPASGEPALRLRLIGPIAEFEIDLTLDVFQDWWLPLKAALGGQVASALQVEVSDGEAAARTAAGFAGQLLARHAGVVQDDNSAHAWTLDEIRAEAVVNGHRFFQPRGGAG